MMTASLADWPRFFERAYEGLAPGGWIELADICPLTSDDGTLTEDLAASKWVNHLMEGCKAIERPFDGAIKYKEQLEAQGFVNVQQVVFKWPQNKWPKDKKHKELGRWRRIQLVDKSMLTSVGIWTLENISSGLHGLSSAVFTRVLGWSAEELEVLLSQVRNDIKDTRIHAYWPM
jgi:hypothetical protein